MAQVQIYSRRNAGYLKPISMSYFKVRRDDFRQKNYSDLFFFSDASEVWVWAECVKSFTSSGDL